VTRTRLTVMRLRSLVVGAALAGCGGSLSCTAVGCISAIGIDLRAATPITAGGSLKICIAESPTCLTQAVGAGQQVVDVEIPTGVVPGPGVNAQGAVPLTIEMVPASGAPATVSGSATFTKNAPNGEQRGPVCYSTTLALTPTAVRQVDPSAMPTPSEQLPDARSPTVG
jgi:hypothetical protein